jgi:hypothetical protein
VFKEGEKPSLLSSFDSSVCSHTFCPEGLEMIERLISCCHRSSCFTAARRNLCDFSHSHRTQFSRTEGKPDFRSRRAGARSWGDFRSRFPGDRSLPKGR